MMKLRINPVVAEDLKSIKEYIGLIFPKESVFKQIISIQFAEIM